MITVRQIINNIDPSLILVDLKDELPPLSVSLNKLEYEENDLNEEVELIHRFHSSDSKDESVIKVYKLKNKNIYFSISE